MSQAPIEQLANKMIAVCKKTKTVKLTRGSFYFGGNRGSEIKYPKISLNLNLEGGRRYGRSFILTGDYTASIQRYLESLFEHRAETLSLTAEDLANATALIQTEQFAEALINSFKLLAVRKGIDFSQIKFTSNTFTRVSMLRYVTLRENKGVGSVHMYYNIKSTHHGEVERDAVTLHGYNALFYNSAHFCASILLHSVALVGKEREYAAAMYLLLKGDWLSMFSKRGLVDVDVTKAEFSQDAFYKYINHAYMRAYGDYLWSDVGGVQSEMIRVLPRRPKSKISGRRVFLHHVGKLPEVFSMAELLARYPKCDSELEKNRLKHRVYHYVKGLCEVVSRGHKQTYRLKQTMIAD